MSHKLKDNFAAISRQASMYSPPSAATIVDAPKSPRSATKRQPVSSFCRTRQIAG
nr:MAG TPA: hypothetical protein [Caudoviricetes sp.]